MALLANFTLRSFKCSTSALTNSSFNVLKYNFTSSQNFAFLAVSNKNYKQFTLTYKYNNLSTFSKRTYSSKDDHGHGHQTDVVKHEKTLSPEEIEAKKAQIESLMKRRDAAVEAALAKNVVPSVLDLAEKLHEYQLFFDDQLHESNFNREVTHDVAQVSGMDPILAEWEHVTGVEREQIEVELAGETIEDELRGPFGTWEHPVIVPSYYHFRLVGCLGHEGKTQHELLWHEVKIGKPLICVECGQVFKLQRIPMPGYEDDPRYKEEEKGNYFIPFYFIVDKIANIKINLNRTKTF